jgi:hypothetical protein
MALETLESKYLQSLNGLSDRSFVSCAIASFVIVILALMFASTLFMNNESVIYDTGRFFEMAKVIVSGATPYLDYQDPKPPLIFFTLTLPLLIGQQFLGGLLLVGVCNLASAIIVMKIGWKLYGRLAGPVAGVLFLVNIGWAQGYFVMTEPFTILFLLLATYFTLFSEKKHYVVAGICAGIAIGFKQYALIAVPLLLLAIYGAQALDASLYWSFGVAAPYISRNRVDPVICTGTNAFELALNVIIAVIISASLYFGYNRFLKNAEMNTGETYFLLSAVGFSLTLLIRQYLHYWALALPFLAILWAGWLLKGDRKWP